MVQILYTENYEAVAVMVVSETLMHNCLLHAVAMLCIVVLVQFVCVRILWPHAVNLVKPYILFPVPLSQNAGICRYFAYSG